MKNVKALADKPLPVYHVMFRGEPLFVETSYRRALERIEGVVVGWSISVRVDGRTWVVWPPSRATRPRAVTA